MSTNEDITFCPIGSLDPIKWQEWSDGGKVGQIIHHVMGWEHFLSWESYQRKYGAQEWGYVKGVAFTTPTHVAFFAYDRWQVFSPDHEELDEFDPLHKINDVWRVVEHIEDANVTVTHVPHAYYRCTIECYNGKRIDVFRDTAPEAICIAALQRAGIEVIV